jgi:uncharacterized membrane protein YhaH (DUF805 family)
MENVMSSQRSLLSAHGRMSRGKYWLIWLLCLGTSFALTLLVKITHTDSVKSSLLLSFFLSLFLAIQGVKRMHDTGRSGWYLFVPLYNLILALTPGVDGENEYGPDPLNPENTDVSNEFSALDSMAIAAKNETPEETQSNDRQAIIYFIISIGFSYLSWLVQMIFFRLNKSTEDYTSYASSIEILDYVSNFISLSLSCYFMATVKNRLARNAFFAFIMIRITLEFLQTVSLSN